MRCRCIDGRMHMFTFGLCSDKVEIKLRRNNQSGECTEYVIFTCLNTDQLFHLLQQKCNTTVQHTTANI